MSLKGQAIIFILQERSGVSPTAVTIEGLRVGAPQRSKDRASRSRASAGARTTPVIRSRLEEKTD